MGSPAPADVYLIAMSILLILRKYTHSWLKVQDIEYLCDMSKYKTLLRVTLTVTIALIMASCGPFSIRERSIILRSGNVMQVMVMPQDSAVLRARSVDLSGRELRSSELKTLAAKMLTTVQDPSQDGVGIAAPQVGINKRVICVMRYDKPGETFEVYYNIYIDPLCGAVGIGPEGWEK